MGPKKTWQDKLRDRKDLPKVVILKENAPKHWRGKTMAVPSPIEINEIMAKIPEGKLITIEQICKIVAHKHGADVGCPLTCGIFSWIAANAAAEKAAEQDQVMLPYWRTLKGKGELNLKYPGGVERQKEYLESEGHKVIQKGRKFIVGDYQKHLVSLEVFGQST